MPQRQPTAAGSCIYYARAVKFAPDNAHPRWLFGGCLVEIGRIPEAIEQFERGLTLTQESPERSSLLKGLLMDGPAGPAIQPASRPVSAIARYRLGRKAEALRTLAGAILCRDWRKSLANEREEWFYHILRREAEAMMLPDLRGFLAGTYEPRSKNEKVSFLGNCQCGISKALEIRKDGFAGILQRSTEELIYISIVVSSGRSGRMQGTTPCRAEGIPGSVR
jgi:hypothetical protein